MLIFPEEGESVAQRAPKAKGSMCRRVEISTFWSPMHVQELGDTEAWSERTGAFHSCFALWNCCSFTKRWSSTYCSSHILWKFWARPHAATGINESSQSEQTPPWYANRCNRWGSFLPCGFLLKTTRVSCQNTRTKGNARGWRIGFWELKGILGHSPCSSRGWMRAWKQPQVFGGPIPNQAADEGESITLHILCPIPHHPSRSGDFIPLSAFLLKPSWFLLLSSLQDCSVLSTVSTWGKPSLILYTKQPPTLSTFPHWQLSKKSFFSGHNLHLSRCAIPQLPTSPNVWIHFVFASSNSDQIFEVSGLFGFLVLQWK